MRILFAAALVAVLAPTGWASGRAVRDRAQAPPEVEAMLKSWPEPSRLAARLMIQTYGAPNEASHSMLLWRDNGAWTRTVVHRDAVTHDFPVPHVDVLEQTVLYTVPVEKFSDLARFNGSLLPARTNGELTVRCESEGMNFLAINLADEVARGKRTPEQARAFLVDTVKAGFAGKSSDYTAQLLFNPNLGAGGDADKSAVPITQEMVRQDEARRGQLKKTLEPKRR